MDKTCTRYLTVSFGPGMVEQPVTLAQELQALADQIKARRPVPAPILRTEPAPDGPRYYSTAYETCVMCGDHCRTFICERCDEGYRQLGL